MLSRRFKVAVVEVVLVVAKRPVVPKLAPVDRRVDEDGVIGNIDR
jgi:hypothetical protein